MSASSSSTDGLERTTSQKQGQTSQDKVLVGDIARKVGPQVEERLRFLFKRANVSYPPSRLTLIGLKDEMELEVWAERQGRWIHIVTYDVLAASGDMGPKQRAGDRQVPEGIYRITTLNPNSNYYLSMKIDYPNDYDRMKAREEGRSNLGGDIFIHGKAKSRGCLAVGDAAIEELFVLASRTGVENTQVLIAPYDFRRKKTLPEQTNGPSWLPELYAKLQQEMQSYRTKEGPI